MTVGFRDDIANRFRLRIAYVEAAEKSAEEGSRRGYPCAEGCAWCCRSVVMVTDGDVALLREGIRAMEPDARAKLEARAAEYASQFAPPTKRGIRASPFGSIAVLEAHWPANGLACPALEETEPGKGSCSLYAYRPLVCRTHYARGEDGTAAGCRPAGPGEHSVVERLDASPLQQRIVSDQKLSLVGLLGLELEELSQEKSARS